MMPIQAYPVGSLGTDWKQKQIQKYTNGIELISHFTSLTAELIKAAFPVPAELADDWANWLTAYLTDNTREMIEQLKTQPDFSAYHPPFDPAELASLEEQREQIGHALAEIERVENDPKPDKGTAAMRNSGLMSMMKPMLTSQLRSVNSQIASIQQMMEAAARETMTKETPDLARSAMPTPLDELNKRGIIKPGDDVGRL
jgi:hypothetical protein